MNITYNMAHSLISREMLKQFCALYAEVRQEHVGVNGQELETLMWEKMKIGAVQSCAVQSCVAPAFKQQPAVSGSVLEKVKAFGCDWFEKKEILTDVTRTKPGSITYLLYGEQPSAQSINIKFGHFGEALAKEMIKSNTNLELLRCGIQLVDETRKTKKDIDLIWVDTAGKIIYIREAKGNIELDTEKLPATFKKITENLMPFVQNKYPGYAVNAGILNWSVYTRDELSKGLSHIKQCEQNGVQVDHWSDFCTLIGFDWPKEDYYGYMREFGKKIEKM